MSKVIGIDLGTTNSCVAVMEGGEAVVIPNPEGNRTTPSVVGFKKDGERLVGETAKRQAITNPDRTIMSIKRHMGTNHKEKIEDKQYTPQEISAMILQKLKADAEAYLGSEVRKRLLLFLHISTTANDKRRRMPERSPDWKYCELSMSRRQLHSHTVWKKEKTKRFWSLT